MYGTNYEIVGPDGVSQELWDKLLENSPQRTPFLQDNYLDVLGYYPEKYIALKKGVPVAGICIPINRESEMATGVVEYAPYQGLIYADKQEDYGSYHRALDVTDVMLDYIYENRKRNLIAFGNSYTVRDVRAVQWHHYHQPDKGIYNFLLQYTGILVLDGGRILDRCSKGRKLDYRYSRERYGLKCVKSDDLNPFSDLYEKTFYRQGIMLPHDEIDKVIKLVHYLLDEEMADLYYAVDSNGKCLDATVFVYEGDKGYYLFGANDPEYRNHGGGTLLMIDQLSHMFDKGVREFDFIGINSPYRGDFKLSFGATVEPYYVCEVDYTK